MPLLGGTRESSRPAGRACGLCRCLGNLMTSGARDARAAVPGAAAQRCNGQRTPEGLPQGDVGRGSTGGRHSRRAVLTHRSANAFRLRSPDRCPDDLHALCSEDLVERTGELRVPVPDHEPNAPEPLPHRQVPGLLGHPSRIGVPGHAEEMHSSGPELDSEEHVHRANPECLQQ